MPISLVGQHGGPADVTSLWLCLGGTSPCCHPLLERHVEKNGVEWKEASTIRRKMMVFRVGS